MERQNIEYDLELIKDSDKNMEITKARLNKLAENIENLNKYKMWIEDIIENEKDETLKMILLYKYQGKKLDEISEILNYSISYISQIYKRFIKSLNE